MKIATILTGHGQFAQGFNSLVEGVLGEVNDYAYLSYGYTDSSEDYIQALNDMIATFEKYDSILILTDMRGGTPFNKALELKAKGANIEILTGTNFAMLMTALTAQDEVSNKNELIELIIEQGKESISLFTLVVTTHTELDSDGI